MLTLCLYMQVSLTNPGTTRRYHLLLSEQLLGKRQQMTSAGEDAETRELSCTAGGNVNWCSHYGKPYGSSSKKLKI